jgi:hypothetical protein
VARSSKAAATLRLPIKPVGPTKKALVKNGKTRLTLSPDRRHRQAEHQDGQAARDEALAAPASPAPNCVRGKAENHAGRDGKGSPEAKRARALHLRAGVP